MVGMVIGIALHSLQFAISVILMALFLGRDQNRRAIPGWLRSASASNVAWKSVVIAGVIVSAAILLLR
jgi:predicted branched-subunit amino acid permease